MNEDITVPEEHRLEECQIHLPFLQLALPIMTLDANWNFLLNFISV